MGICSSLLCPDDDDGKTKPQSHGKPLRQDEDEECAEAPKRKDNNNKKQKPQQQSKNEPTAPAAKSQRPVNPHAKLITGVKVRNVYDGDTLTLVDERRVRFLGIDAPEIKEKEDFAKESKEFVKKLCNKEEVDLEVDEREETDKYGRLLAFVWVVDDETGERVCVNDEVLKAGLVAYYHPSHDTPLPQQDWMLGLQKEARAAKRGIWSVFEDGDVYCTRSGRAFHRKDCEHVSSYHLTARKKSECLDEAMSGCRTCHP